MVHVSEKLMSNLIPKKSNNSDTLLSVSGSMQKLERWTRSLLATPSSTPSAHKSVLVADLKLADFKQFLANKGLQVEFGGATLRCGEYFTVCKIGDFPKGVMVHCRGARILRRL